MDSLISHLLDAGRIEAGTPVGDARAVRGGRPGGCREEHVPERRWQAYRTDRSARGPSAGNGRPAAHRAGVEQPILQRRPARSGYLPDPGLRVADGIQVAISVRDEGRGVDSGATATPVPKIRRPRRRQSGERERSGPRHLQGPDRSPRRTHLGRQRRRRPRHVYHVHDPGGARSRWRERFGPQRLARRWRSARANAHPRRRRRPGDSALCSGRALGGRL